MKRFVAAATVSAGLLIQAAIIPTAVIGPSLAKAPAAAPAAAAPVETAAPAPAPAPEVPKSTGKVVFIDPGHGGSDAGAVHEDANGRTDMTEKEANLSIALKLADMLRKDGYEVRLARTTDTRPIPNGSTAADLQARADEANKSGADLFVSIHNNASANPSLRGTEVYYCGDRSFGDDNARLAKLVNKGLVSNLKKAGYDTVDRGVKDEDFMGHYAVLGADNLARPTKMVGILGESLYLSNDQDAAQLKKDEIRTAIARGYFEGIDAYFGNGQS